MFEKTKMKILLLIASLLLSTHALADEASKRQKIHELARAQGLEQMFQVQIDQGKSSTSKMGVEFFDKLAKDSGLEASPDDPEVRRLFTQLAERLAALHTAKEYMDAWSRSYGKELSESDIDNMLKYYRSPVGKRDIRASQSAMAAFSQTIVNEQMVRMTALTENMVKELKAITTK